MSLPSWFSDLIQSAAAAQESGLPPSEHYNELASAEDGTTHTNATTPGVGGGGEGAAGQVEGAGEGYAGMGAGGMDGQVDGSSFGTQGSGGGERERAAGTVESYDASSNLYEQPQQTDDGSYRQQPQQNVYAQPNEITSHQQQEGGLQTKVEPGEPGLIQAQAPTGTGNFLASKKRDRTSAPTNEPDNSAAIKRRRSSVATEDLDAAQEEDLPPTEPNVSKIGFDTALDGLKASVPALRAFYQIAPFPELTESGTIDGVAPLEQDSKLSALAASRDYIHVLQTENSTIRRALLGMEDVLRELEGEESVQAWREDASLKEADREIPADGLDFTPLEQLDTEPVEGDDYYIDNQPGPLSAYQPLESAGKGKGVEGKKGKGKGKGRGNWAKETTSTQTDLESLYPSQQHHHLDPSIQSNAVASSSQLPYDASGYDANNYDQALAQAQFRSVQESQALAALQQHYAGVVPGSASPAPPPVAAAVVEPTPLSKTELAKQKNREKQRRFRERQKKKLHELERQVQAMEEAKRMAALNPHGLPEAYDPSTHGGFGGMGGGGGLDLAEMGFEQHAALLEHGALLGLTAAAQQEQQRQLASSSSTSQQQQPDGESKPLAEELAARAEVAARQHFQDQHAAEGANGGGGGPYANADYESLASSLSSMHEVQAAMEQQQAMQAHAAALEAYHREHGLIAEGGEGDEYAA